MTERSYKKLPASPAEALCKDIDLTDEAKALLKPELSPAQFLESLIAGQHFIDAVRFLSRILPKRESTWWACLASRKTLGESPKEEYVNAVEAAERWVYQPSEENRRHCQTAAENTAYDHPASWAAMAGFWSSGSMAPADVPAVPPAEYLTGRAVAGAVMLAAVLTEPEKAPEKYRLFLEQGIDIACGGDGRKIQPQPSS